MTTYKNDAHEYFSKMTNEEFVEALENAGFEVEYAGKGLGGKIIIEDEALASELNSCTRTKSMDKVAGKSNEEINPAIAYALVMDMLSEREDKDSMCAWDSLYKLSMKECTHRHLDGTSSWSYPYDDRDFKLCDYCSSN